MRKVKIAVIGGGITGQLVQIQLPEAQIFDWRPRPAGGRAHVRSYGANYLWHPLPGLPVKSFTVQTRIDGDPATYASVKAYKEKIGKSADPITFESVMAQFSPEMTGYEFDGLPETAIQYGHRVTSIDRLHHTITFAEQGELQYDLLVSTIPLYSLLSLVGIPEPPGRLKFKPIFFKVMSRPPDAPFPREVMYVNYISRPDVAPYRVTDRDGERHFESIVPYDGMTSTKRFAPGKIYPHADVPDLVEYLDSFGITTFGRFGSWRPDELVHETWQQIEEWKEVMSA